MAPDASDIQVANPLHDEGPGQATAVADVGVGSATRTLAGPVPVAMRVSQPRRVTTSCAAGSSIERSRRLLCLPPIWMGQSSSNTSAVAGLIREPDKFPGTVPADVEIDQS